MSTEKEVNLDELRKKAFGHVVRLTNTPFGFFEREVCQFFSQFGAVKRVRVPRSKKGSFKGRVYIYFADPEVAKIAASSMNNYLLFEKRIKSTILTENIPPSVLTGPRIILAPPVPDRVKKEVARKVCDEKDEDEIKLFQERLAKSIDKAMYKVQKAGYKYKFEYRHKLEKA